MRKKNVPGLLAAERCLFLLHPLQNILVPYRRAQHLYSIATQRGFQAHIGHGCGYDQPASKQLARKQVTRRQQKNGVSIDDPAVSIGKEGAVCVSIKGHSDVRSARLCFCGHNFRMQRAAIGIDIAAVRRGMSEISCAAEMREKLRRDSGSRSVRAVEHKMQAIQAQIRNSSPEEPFVISTES